MIQERNSEIDWEQREYPAGSTVKFCRVGQEGEIETGTLLTKYNADDTDDWTMPQILTEDREIIHGCECWWIPENEISKTNVPQ